VRWAGGEDKVGPARFFAHLAQTAERFESVEPLPHWPRLPGAYYLHRDPAGGDGKALAELCSRFRPASAQDADLLHALFLTLFWGGGLGKRPAFLIEGADDDGRAGRGVGKSTAAKLAARLAGGHIDVRPAEDFDKLMTRLLSPAALDRRLALLDNVKALRFSWADLEALITIDVLSGRQLYVGEGRRPNTLVWLITVNHAGLSRDLAQRCVPIRLERPDYDPRWESEVTAFIDERRWDIIGDVLAELKRPVPRLERYCRWDAWEQDVLAHVRDPDAAQRHVAQRQQELDDEAPEADLVRAAFAQFLERRGHVPLRDVVFIPSRVAADVVNEATGERRPTNKASAYLGTLSITELRKSKQGDDGVRGWCWRGKESPPGAPMAELLPPASEVRDAFYDAH
jgi:hypothetical protein